MRRPFLVALVASILLHGLLAALPLHDLTPPDEDGHSMRPLQARLVSPSAAKATPAPTSAPMPTPLPKPKPSAKPKVPSALRPPPAPTPPPPVAKVPELPDIYTDTRPSDAPRYSGDSSAPPDTDDVPTPSPSEAPAATENFEAKLVFDLEMGDKGLIVGQVTHDIKVEDGRYSISGVVHATGLFSLFYSGRMVQLARGKVVGQRLQPESFWLQRGQSADSTDAALFDWANGTLDLRKGKEDKRVSLPGGTIDILSLAYQFALMRPEPGTAVTLPVTDGRKLETYTYRVRGTEAVPGPNGEVEAVHIVRDGGEGQERVELWLDPETSWLPVRLLLSDKKGEIALQILREIGTPESP